MFSNLTYYFSRHSLTFWTTKKTEPNQTNANQTKPIFLWKSISPMLLMRFGPNFAWCFRIPLCTLGCNDLDNQRSHFVTKCSFCHSLTCNSNQKKSFTKIVKQSVLRKEMLSKLLNIQSFGHRTFISSQPSLATNQKNYFTQLVKFSVLRN